MNRAALALALLTPLAAPLTASAQAVNPCGEWAAAEHLVEPWADSAATYAGGAIRVALLDTVEPGPAAFHLLILSPPFDEVGARQCRTISWVPAAGGWPSGFQSIDFAARAASYDPARGLTLTMPATTMDPDTGDGRAVTLTVRINQATGKIEAALR